MDAWFWLLLLVLYVLFGVLGKKKKQSQENPTAPQSSAPTMQDALQEIRMVLEGTPEPPPTLPPVRAPAAELEPVNSWSDEFIPHTPTSDGIDLHPGQQEGPLSQPATKQGSDLHARMRRQLRHRDSAREAFLISEILSAPHVRRRPTRGRQSMV